MSREPEDIPEPDRVPGAPHPRFAPRVIGQDAAVAEFLNAAASGRMHHAWLLTGPRGSGKATLAWAMARWLLAGGTPDRLTVPLGHPALPRIEALSEPGLLLIRRPWDDKAVRLRAEITVDEVRRLGAFFHMSSAGGGRRVAILDAADDLNPQAANALLKLLEEPPRDGVLILIAHQPARLLPTIRSRCRVLRLASLAPESLAGVLADLGAPDPDGRLAALSGGSAGEALRLAGQDGAEVYQAIVDLFATAPRMDRQAMAALADGAAKRARDEGGDAFDLTVTLLDRFLSRLARTGLHGAPLPQAARGEGAVLARLCPDAQAARDWAEAQAAVSARARAGRAVNLDPATLVMDMLTALAQTPPAQTAARA